MPRAESRSSTRRICTESGRQLRMCCSSWSVALLGTRRPCLFPGETQIREGGTRTDHEYTRCLLSPGSWGYNPAQLASPAKLQTQTPVLQTTDPYNTQGTRSPTGQARDDLGVCPNTSCPIRHHQPGGTRTNRKRSWALVAF